MLEVGLGGRLDATNVVREPYVCGITSLGYDHMEILGHTLPEIAAEKAGILKKGAPAFTVQQPADAMQVLQVTPWPTSSPDCVASGLLLRSLGAPAALNDVYIADAFPENSAADNQLPI